MGHACVLANRRVTVHDDGFQHPACLCCIFLNLSHDDDWGVLEKCCIIWAEFFPDANNTLQSRLIFVGISFIFCRFDAASWPPDTLLPLASFSYWAVLIQHYDPRSFYPKTFVFLIDVRTNVCYNIFSATMNGRRLVLPKEDCDLWSQRNLLAEILMKGGLVLCWQLSCLFRSLACVLHALRLDTQ